MLGLAFLSPPTPVALVPCYSRRFVFVSIQQAKEDEDRGVRNGDSASIAGSDLEGPTADSIRMVGIRKAPGEHLGITVKENEKGELAIARFVFAGETNIK